MIYEPETIDLSILAEHFIVTEDYTREICLAELKMRQNEPDFLVLIDEEEGNINGFLIAYRVYNSLWLNQIWRQADSKLSHCRKVMSIVRNWAKDRGMTSITGETKRTEMKALGRYGFEEYSVVIRAKI